MTSSTICVNHKLKVLECHICQGENNVDKKKMLNKIIIIIIVDQIKIIIVDKTKQSMLKKLLNGPRQSQACNQLYKPYSWDSEKEVGLSLRNPQNIALRIVARSG